MKLFGYTPPSLTGVLRGPKKGKIHQASGGTLFLDEIAELDLAWGKVLHVIEEGTVGSYGSHSDSKVDVRIIAATNRNLSELVKRGYFREDLYYRLNVFSVEIPPLRESPRI